MRKHCVPARGERNVGKPFNPWKVFGDVILVPSAILPLRNISSGAKITYGRLLRYAGRDGRCYPAVRTLADALGTSARQMRRYLGELEAEKFIQRVPGKGTTNSFVFLWHSTFETVRRSSPGKAGGLPPAYPGQIRQPTPDRPVTQRESARKKSRRRSDGVQSEGRSKEDLDYQPRFAKSAKPRTDDPDTLENTVQYGQLTRALTKYMEGDKPSARLVIDVMNAARQGYRGVTEGDVVECLWYLYNERGLRPGTKCGPRHWSWFKTVVQDYFQQRHDREAAANPYASGSASVSSR